jgi:alpha-tubulin suppressor-like RCC1 family protein
MYNSIQFNSSLLNSNDSIFNLLLIDNTVPEYQTFVDSANSNTFPVVYSRSSTKNDLLALLSELQSLQRIGFVFETRGTMSQTFLDDLPFFKDNESSPYSENLTWLIDVIREFGVKNVDFLACNSLNYAGYSNYYDILTQETGVVVGASNDATGNIKYGGDWVMESTMEDIEMVYFKESIEYYRYLLSISYHTMVLMSNGTVYGTGSNVLGQLGNGQQTDRTTLTPMSNNTGKTPVAISCGYIHTMVLMSDGTVYGMGYNNKGQLGNVTPIMFTTLTPMTNTTGKTPVAISCATDYTIILMSDGTIYGTGFNDKGQLGNGTTNNSSTLTPMTMTSVSGKTPVAISCGTDYTIVLMSDGTIYGTGNNSFGALGNGTTNNSSTLTPMTMTSVSGKTPVAISCGNNHTMVLMSDGTVYGTGQNNSGQLANGTTNNSSTLTPMTNNTGKTPVTISCGNHTIVLMSDGTVYGTGYNDYGQLGNGTTNNPSTLTPMINNTGKTPLAITCGLYHTIVLMSDGIVYGMGYNNKGQLGNGTTNNSITLTPMTNTYSPAFPVRLFDSSYNMTLTTLKGAGYSATDLKTIGYTARQLKDAGYTAGQLKDGGYTTKQIQDTGYTLAQLQAGGVPFNISFNGLSLPYFSSIFSKYISGPKANPTGIFINGTDLCNLFAPYMIGAKANPIGILAANGVDICDIFQPINVIAPVPPSNIALQSISDVSASFTFSTVTGALSYFAITTTGITAASLSSPLVLNGLGAGTSYSVMLQTFNPWGLSLPSKNISITTYPANPTLTQTITNVSMTISYTGYPAPTYYSGYLTPTLGGSSQLVTSTNTVMSFTGLISNTGYKLLFTAANVTGQSKPSIVNFITL